VTSPAGLEDLDFQPRKGSPGCKGKRQEGTHPGLPKDQLY
jgi:hypothetical protein